MSPMLPKKTILCSNRGIRCKKRLKTMAEYISKAIALAENASKLSQRVSQGIVENARELGLDSASRYFDTSEEKMHDIRRQLDSRNDREKLDGLKRLIAVRAP